MNEPNKNKHVDTENRVAITRGKGKMGKEHQLYDDRWKLHFWWWVCYRLEKAMAPHSSVLVWRIPGTGEPPGLLSMGSYRVGHNWSDLAAVAAAAACYRLGLSRWCYWLPANTRDVRDPGSVPGLGRSPAGATHSSILTWRIPWTEEPGGMQFIGPQRVKHDWSDFARMHAIGYIEIEIKCAHETVIHQCYLN